MSNSTFAALSHRMPGAVHELGPDSSSWAKKAKLDWKLKESEVAFTPDGKRMAKFEGRRILFRDDTEEPLSVVGKRFKPIQPQQILDFYGHMSEKYGFKLAIAGSTDNGVKIWALAETPHHLEVIKGDKVFGGLFLATACDGSMSTQAYFTSFRLWCENQLPIIHRLARQGAHNGLKAGGKVFRITHSAHFNPEQVERDLEMMNYDWEEFARLSKALAQKKITRQQAINFFASLYYKGDKKQLTEEDIADMRGNTELARVMKSYDTGDGQKQIADTAWALVNAVTFHMDNAQTVKDETVRVRKNWIEGGVRTKAAVFNKAVELLK